MNISCFKYNSIVCLNIETLEKVDADISEADCGPWTEWSGSCFENNCGQCAVQNRTRKANNINCTPLSDSRQCYNLACVPSVPQVSDCTPGCMSRCKLEYLANGQARCKIDGTTIDPAKDIYNKSDSIQFPGKSCYPSMRACGLWTEWTGDCENQRCGQCKVQTRTRTNVNKCTLPLSDSRQCYNLACVPSVPQVSDCTPGCMSGCKLEYLANRQARCKIDGTTIDPAKDIYNKTDSIQFAGKSCYPSMRACGLWTEWTGDCETKWCGQCNVQNRTRVNVNKCTLDLKETRQCCNLACRKNTQPNCFTGNGCLPDCKWVQLDASYYNGRFTGQARCILPGTNIRKGIDDYQIWMNRTDTVSMTTCNPALKPSG